MLGREAILNQKQALTLSQIQQLAKRLASLSLSFFGLKSRNSARRVNIPYKKGNRLNNDCK